MIDTCTRAIQIVLTTALFCAPVNGQNRLLSIHSNAPDAHVFVDGARLGTVSEGPFPLPMDARHVTVKQADLTSWAIVPIDFSLGDSTHVVLNATFPVTYKVESLPSGAHVRHVVRDSIEHIGSTPLLYRTDRSLKGRLLLSLDQYKPVEVIPGAALWNRHLVELEYDPASSMQPDGFGIEIKRRRWINVVALSGSLAAGVLAVHFRTKADNRFEEWEVSGSSALKDRVQQLDVYSGVSVGAMQLGLGVFAYRLVF